MNMAKRLPLSDEDIAAKRYEANQIFTPSAPVAIADLFAGRQRQLTQIIDAIGERGRHAILYGEPGVGKSPSCYRATLKRFAIFGSRHFLAMASLM